MASWRRMRTSWRSAGTRRARSTSTRRGTWRRRRMASIRPGWLLSVAKKESTSSPARRSRNGVARRGSRPRSDAAARCASSGSRPRASSTCSGIRSSGGSGRRPPAASSWSCRLPARTCSSSEAWLSGTSARPSLLFQGAHGVEVDLQIVHHLAVLLAEAQGVAVDLDLDGAGVAEREDDLLLGLELQRLPLHAQLGEAVLAVDHRLDPAALGEVERHLERRGGLR